MIKKQQFLGTSAGRESYPAGGNNEGYGKYRRLEFIQGSKKSKDIPEKYTSGRNIDIKNREVKTEIDIRGYNAEEAVFDIDKFIDQAVLWLNLTKLQIIHGKVQAF